MVVNGIVGERELRRRVNGRKSVRYTSNWRRGWDSNPRYGKTVNRISNPAHSTTLPPLRLGRVEGREFYGARQQYTTRQVLRCCLSGSRRQNNALRNAAVDSTRIARLHFSARQPCPISVKSSATKSPASAGASRVNNPLPCSAPRRRTGATSPRSNAR